MNWPEIFAERTALMRRSAVRELLQIVNRPGMISFAGGLPAPELFPTAEIRVAADKVLQEQPHAALQYGQTEGVGELRDWIAAQYHRPHCPVRRENVMIVSGSQQAFDLIGKVFLDQSDRVWVENPTYLAALSAWRPYGVIFEAVPSDMDGMCVEQLPPFSEPPARLLYVVPNFQNPQGTTLSLGRRKILLERLHGQNIPIVEDNPYGDLRFDGAALPHLLELDAREDADGKLDTRVIHLGTFSKVLAPGLRVGWVIAHEAVIDKLVQAKQAADLHTGTFCQYTVLELLRAGVLDRQIPQLRAAYAGRREAMLAALKQYFPPGATWMKPAGGMFLFVTLPESLESKSLLPRALERKVAFVPGEEFHVDGAGKSTMRLNFSNANPEKIAEGIERLGEILRNAVT